GPCRLLTKYGCMVTPALAMVAATNAFSSGVTATSFWPILDIHTAPPAGVASGEEVGKPPAEQPLVGSVEQGILGPFQPAAGIAQRIEAGNRRVHRGIGIDPQETEAGVGGDRIRQQLAARSDL